MSGLQSRTQLISNALLLLGGSPIASITEESTGALLGANLFENTYREMLSSFRWRFASKVYQLNRLSSTPATGYSYAYQFPSDVLYLIQTDTKNYEVYGTEIHSNTPTLQAEYITRVDEDKLPAYFSKALEYNLAAQFAVPLTGDINKGKYYESAYNNAIKKARFMDSSQRPTERADDSIYISVRH